MSSVFYSRPSCVRAPLVLPAPAGVTPSVAALADVGGVNRFVHRQSQWRTDRLRQTLFVCLLGFAISAGIPPFSRANIAANEPVAILFDTDIENDVDDVGAVAVLHKLADKGEVRVLGMGVSVSHAWSAPCLDALNTYYGRPEIPIGVPKSKAPDTGSKYARGVSQEFAHRLGAPEMAPNVVTLYRRLLAGEPDRSVVLVTVGFLTNVANLIDSAADEASPLDGRELVAKKIKLWVAMAGAFPSGREWNVFQDTDASRRALADWPTPILFSGFEIGSSIQTGAALRGASADDPVRRAYELYNGIADRSSWDQTAVLAAVRDAEGRLANLWEVSKPGAIEIRPDGSNGWREAADGRQRYLVAKAPPREVARVIEGLMIEPPSRKNAR